MEKKPKTKTRSIINGIKNTGFVFILIGIMCFIIFTFGFGLVFLDHEYQEPKDDRELMDDYINQKGEEK